MPFPVVAAIAAAGAIYSLIKKEKAAAELRRLHNRAVPELEETGAQRTARLRAEEMAKTGYTPAEKAAFRKNVAEDINTQSQRALDIGGGQLGKVISGMGKINQMNAESRFAASDADLHRQNIRYRDKFSNELQRISDENIRAQLRQGLMAEQALGTAVQNQDTNMVNFATLGLSQIGGGAATPTGSATTATNPVGSTQSGWKNMALGRIASPDTFDYENRINSDLDPNATDPLMLYKRLSKFKPLNY